MVNVVNIFWSILSLITFCVIFVFLFYVALGLKRKHRVILTICGIIMQCCLPFTWAIYLGQLLSPSSSSSAYFHSVFLWSFPIALIGSFIVMILYSFFLSIGLMFLNIGLIETIEQTILSQTYPFLSFSILSWYMYLIIGVLPLLLAIPERIIRSEVENN